MKNKLSITVVLDENSEPVVHMVEDLVGIIYELFDALTEVLYPIDDIIELNEDECFWCGSVNGHEDDCPLMIAKQVCAKYLEQNDDQ